VSGVAGFPADRCRSCNAPIRWAVSLANGKALPLDETPAETGNVWLHEAGEEGGNVDVAEVLAGDRLDRARKAEIDLYLSHFATCPDAGRWRK
jgi:hypothetical protein